MPTTETVTGSLSDPEFRRRRALHAARVRNSLDNHIRKIVDAAPALTAEQRDRLALIFKTPETGGGSGA